MKYTSLLILFVSVFTSVKAQERMIVHLNNGQKVTYDIKEIKEVEIESQPTNSGIEASAINLGLSVLWASHNLGATTASEKGNTYTHESAISGGQEWSNDWRLPTEEEWQELSERCNWTWTMVDGINGRMVTGPSGESLFIPATGLTINDEVHVAGCMGIYWSATTTSENASNASGLYFDSANAFVMGFPRSNTHSVRLVKDNTTTQSADDQQQNRMLIMSLSDGMKHCYTLDKALSVVPSADSIIVKSQHINVAYARTSVKGYSFATKMQIEDGIADVKTVEGTSIKIERMSNVIIVKGLPSGTKATVFNITGALCEPKIHYENDSDKTDIVINTSTLPHSTYIITLKGTSNIPSIKFNR